MFKTALNVSHINCDQKSLVYAFECDSMIDNELKTVIKVGQTSRTIKERLSSYNESNIRNIYWIQVENPFRTENDLLIYLVKVLKLEIAKGREFFFSDMETIKQAMLKINSPLKPITSEQNNFPCEYCKKDYSSKKSLELHLKTAKFCFNLRKKSDEEKIIEFSCEYCENKFSVKANLDRHMVTCKFKQLRQKEKEMDELKKQYEATIYKLENQIKELENQVKELEVNSSKRNYNYI